MLDSKSVDFFTVSSILEYIERCLIQISETESAVARARGYLPRLEHLGVPSAAELRKFLNRFDRNDGSNQPQAGQVKERIDGIVRAANKETVYQQVTEALTIQRLRSLKKRSLFFAVLIVIFSPLILNVGSLKSEWPLTSLILEMANLRLEQLPKIAVTAIDMFGIIGISIVGALGGFISGLYEIQNSEVSFPKYQESTIRIQLKPWLGAILSSMLFILLS